MQHINKNRQQLSKQVRREIAECIFMHIVRGGSLALAQSLILHVTLTRMVSRIAYGLDKSFSHNPILAQLLMFGQILI